MDWDREWTGAGLMLMKTSLKDPHPETLPDVARESASFIRDNIPSAGLFAGHDWRVSPEPFRLGPKLAQELERLGRVLLQFYRAVNLLYRKSLEGKQPEWVARWLDIGKPP